MRSKDLLVAETFRYILTVAEVSGLRSTKKYIYNVYALLVAEARDLRYR